MLTNAAGFWPITFVVLELLVRLGFIGLVLMRRRPASVTLAWVVVILAVPLLGIILYLLVGEVRLGRRRIQKHRDIVARIESSQPFVCASVQSVHQRIDPAFSHIAVLAESAGENEPLGGNAMRLIGDTPVFIQSLVEDIDNAQHHCHLLFYIFLADYSGTRVAEALMRAAQRGVACRLLVDGVGSNTFLKSGLHTRLREAGVRVVEALAVNPFRMLLARVDLRNHRKIAVIDGVIGYTGSQNIADAEFAPKPRFAPWVDAMIRVEGPLAWDLQVLFIEDWYMDTDESLDDLLHIHPVPQPDNIIGQVIGTGPNSFTEALRQLNQAMFHTARQELIVTTPYFVPDDATLTALCATARRGVDTMLVLPARNDSPLVAAASRSHYDELLACGVRIYEFQKGLLHAKTVTVDRDLALISTANLDRRSFELNFEVSVVVYDDDFASQLRFLQRGYIGESRLVEPAQWNRRLLPAKLWHNAAGTLSPLL
jgi:cardiolipin synthase A/B